jgi:hypothetical protein
MSRFFILPENGIGPGGDIIFRKGGIGWLLYADGTLLGQLSQRNRKWTGISHAHSSEFFKVRMMDGFATRMDAATFIIMHHGYWMQNERTR